MGRNAVGLIALLCLFGKAALASQSQPDTVLVHSVYAGQPLRSLVTGVQAIAQGAFRREDAESIQKQAVERAISRSSDAQRQIELRYGWRVPGRSGRRAVLAMYLLSTQAYRYDVRIQAADDGLMKAIRARLAELEIDSLIPIDRVRLTLAEESAPNTPPRLVLRLRTSRDFACLGFHIDHDLKHETFDSIFLNLHGVSPPLGPCPAAMGPATMSRELSLQAGKYTLVVTYGDRDDRLMLDIADTLTAVTGVDSSLVEADERPRWRYPRNSFAFFCVNADRGAGPLCADAEGWLARQPGISRLSFGPGAINPYTPDPASRPGDGAWFFRYDREVSFERLRLCFGAIQSAIQEAVGVGLAVTDWRGVGISANSRRANHERHIEVPQRISDIPACRTPSWSD